MEAYQTLMAECEVTWLVDIVPGKAQRFMEEFGMHCRVAEDFHEALGEDVDLVDVCTPPYVHASISIEAMQHGKHVICEKPMAASLEECDAMLKARDESGKKLSIIAQNRFRKPIRDLKMVLDSGLAGNVRHAQVDSLWWRGHCYYDLWWRGTWEKEGGGCTLNHAVHHIDMLLWMLGRPEEVTSVLANVSHDNAEVEDLSVSILRYPSSLCQLTASVVDHGEEQKLVFQCEKARISAPFSCAASLSKSNGFPEKNEALEREIQAFVDALPPLPFEGHTGQIADVLSAIREDRQPAIGGEDGRNTIELISAIYLSGTEGKTVRLPLLPDSPFYTRGGMLGGAPHFYEKNTSVMELGGSITLGSDYKS
ncbi:MAG: Gfo/Idh/MocA family oxidoreductase [Clostridia bacterium]|nr:Gfo/Idh/MocA family oxidoreductase [Clostridia bacterium]